MREAGVPLGQYAYGEHPLREEIVQTIQPDAAVITRNLYGALVLNTSRTMFIDIDFAPASLGARTGGLLHWLRGKRAAAPPDEPRLQQVRQWAAGRPDLGLRAYRTFAGLRCVVTSQVFDPTAPQTLELLQTIGSDPLYVRLCQAQGCFRARLTPKPWRCRTSVPPA
ncbi:MAG: hypothetical protein ACRDHE_04485, partial [Ktedonobacterales bacterium]